MLASERYDGLVGLTVFIVNAGNRPAAILNAGFSFYPLPNGQKEIALDAICRNDDGEVAPGVRRSELSVRRGGVSTGGRMDPPAPIIEPGKIVQLNLSTSVRFDWDEIGESRRVDSCIYFSILDNSGRVQRGIFPVSTIGFWPFNHPSFGPGWSVPTGPWRLL
jgi:hypothetical protein